jgi:3'(2'), 5'-bisphosphate nucleotidase
LDVDPSCAALPKANLSKLFIFAGMKNNYSTAIQAALSAGEAIMEVYGSEDFGIEAKEDTSPLTLADRRAHQIITGFLEETEYPVLSEEGRHIPYAERSLWHRFWLVDPLDGTREFIKRNGEFTVNIALVEDGKALFGVVFAPVIRELYVGIPGRGAYRCTKEFNFTQPMDYLLQFADALPQKNQHPELFTVVSSRSHYNEETREFVEALDAGGRELRLVSKGSSLKLCLVASGEADIYPRLGPTMEWDTAAAHAVVKASGRNVYRTDNGEELSYNKQNLLNPYFVVK